MFHDIAAHSFGVNISFQIVGVALEISSRKHLMIRIRYLIRPDSAIHIVLIRSIVARLSYESVIREDEVVVDHVISGDSCCSLSWWLAVTIVVGGIVVLSSVCCWQYIVLQGVLVVTAVWRV